MCLNDTSWIILWFWRSPIWFFSDIMIDPCNIKTALKGLYSAEWDRNVTINVIISVNTNADNTAIRDEPKLRPKLPQHNFNSNSYKMPSKFNFELNFFISLKNLCSYSLATATLLIWILLDPLEGAHSASFRIFHSRPIRLTIQVFRMDPVRKSGMHLYWLKGVVKNVAKYSPRKHREKPQWTGRAGTVKPRVVTQPWVAGAFW
jgi:hypothetical protein